MIAIVVLAVLMVPARIVVQYPILILFLLAYLAPIGGIIGILFALDRILAIYRTSSKVPTPTEKANSSGEAERV
jgi:TRAP-type C4-dicarboxylate transport system permease small subunit